MKIDFDTILKDLSGDELKDKDKGAILKDICVEALLANIPNKNKEPETGKVKMVRWELAKKITVGGKIEVTSEDITLLKDRVGLAYGTLVVGSATEILEKTNG